MKPFSEMDHHPTVEKLTAILMTRAQNTNPLFFRVAVSYYITVMASMMRAKVLEAPTTAGTAPKSAVPINMYCINLATSGSGKGITVNLMEEEVLNQFEHRFREVTFPSMAERHMPKLALKRARRNSSDPADELQALEREFESKGPMVFSFDSATSAAVKQAREKLLLADAGSMNLQIDEIGSNLLGNQEVLDTYIELFDIGRLKQKLTKNTNDNIRHEEVGGRTPTNMMLFGTPSRLLNGGKVEEALYAMLDSGYARRCFFGFVNAHTRDNSLTPAEIYQQRNDPAVAQYIENLSDHLATLADIPNVNREIQISKDLSEYMIEYQQDCIARAAELPEHEVMRKSEISNRQWKALKLAGAYAFLDGNTDITEDNVHQAIRLAEDSGEAFQDILTPERPYVKLAKYIANVKRPVTQPDLVEDLPFYRGSKQQKEELMTLAIAHGYLNNILIKKTYTDGIEFLRGETLTPTDLKQIKISFSTDIADDYQTKSPPFDELHKLTQKDGYHWINHALKDGDAGAGHRCEENIIPGFNMLVIDVDHGVNMSTAQMLLADYKALFYTTKRHTEEENRYRILMPINYILELDAKDYKELMNNVFDWLPFQVDRQTNQRARKWLSHDGDYFYQDGEVLDILPFIPKTSKNEKRQAKLNDQQSLDNLERWVINNTGDGNRNNQLLRYAMVLVDAGFDFDDTRKRVMALNDKLVDKLEEAEILGTIMVTVGKAIAARP